MLLDATENSRHKEKLQGVQKCDTCVTLLPVTVEGRLGSAAGANQRKWWLKSEILLRGKEGVSEQT